MQDYLQGLERMTASLEQRRREEADELQRMGQTFGYVIITIIITIIIVIIIII